MKFQRSDKGSVKDGVGKNRQDIFEQYSWRGEVGKLSERFMKDYLEIGEFGGGGGGGGGESGVFGGSIGLVSRWM